MIPFNLRDAQMIHEERLRRSSRRRFAEGKELADSYARPVAEADIVEVAFGTACEIERMGA
ncbi:MAG: hypothetical protein PVF87_01910 [Acidimicrobiia bacterium]|jgi:hypothetical protein